MHNKVGGFTVKLVMNRFQSFLWWCAGVDREMMQQCKTDSSKYVGIGASVMFTGIFAALAAGYALYTVFDSYLIAILSAILWGFMIFNLDRYIVSSMRKNGKVKNELLMALPRFLLAIIISIVIATPLELKIFEKEINAELVMMQQEDISRKEVIVENRVKDENAVLKAEIQALENAILEKEAKRDELRRIAQAEADGTGGSKQRNAGPIYQIKKADADRAEAELNELKVKNEILIVEKRVKLRQNELITSNEIRTIEAASLDGLASRLEAMDRLKERSSAINIAHIFILLLFIAIETTPILVKLIAPKGPYDYLLKSGEYQFEVRQYKEVAVANSTIRKEADGLSSEELEFVSEKLKIGLEKF